MVFRLPGQNSQVSLFSLPILPALLVASCQQVQQAQVLPFQQFAARLHPALQH